MTTPFEKFCKNYPGKADEAPNYFAIHYGSIAGDFLKNEKSASEGFSISITKEELNTPIKRNSDDSGKCSTLYELLKAEFFRVSGFSEKNVVFTYNGEVLKISKI